MIIVPLIFFLIWMFILAIVGRDQFDDSNHSFVKLLVIPGASAIVWSIAWQITFYRSMKEYEKNRKRLKLSKIHFSVYDTYLNIHDIRHFLISSKFSSIQKNLYYKYEKLDHGDSSTDIHTFVKIEEANASRVDTFNYVISDEEPFQNAYKQKVMNRTEKYLIILSNEFFEYEKRMIEKLCIEWKVQAMRYSALMPNEFWIPIVYIPQEQKLYILEYMSKKRKIEKLLGVQFKKTIIGEKRSFYND